jgi:NDP-sugar pyrophosphorylase family protein
VMKALVLSAGRGERLLPLTETVPKPLVHLGGRPLIDYPIRMLAHSGVTEIAINAHHLAAALETALGRGDALGVRITWAPETVLLGTGGPLVGLRDFFGSETFAVLNCDTIIDLDLHALAGFHRARGALATMVLRSPDDSAIYSRVELDADSRIRRMRLLRGRAAAESRGPAEFDDYPASLGSDEAARLSSYMYCGVMLCEPAAFKLMPSSLPFSLTADLLAPMVAQGFLVFGYLHAGFFRTVDDLKSLEALRSEFAAAPPHLPFL